MEFKRLNSRNRERIDRFHARFPHQLGKLQNGIILRRPVPVNIVNAQRKHRAVADERPAVAVGNFTAGGGDRDGAGHPSAARMQTSATSRRNSLALLSINETSVNAGACLINGNVPGSEGVLRQSRQIFAGILIGFKKILRRVAKKDPPMGAEKSVKQALMETPVNGTCRQVNKWGKGSCYHGLPAHPLGVQQ